MRGRVYKVGRVWKGWTCQIVPDKANQSNRKRKRTRKRSKRIFTMRDLDLPPQTTFEDYLLYLSEHPDKADKLLRPGEQWAVEIYGNKTFVPFSTAALFRPSGYLDRYEGLMNWARDPGRVDELINNVRIVKVGEAGQSEDEVEQNFDTERQAEKRRMEEETQELIEMFKAGTPEAAEKRKPSKHSLLKAAADRVKNLEKIVSDLTKIEREAKRAAKKSAPKKTARKQKAAPKPTPKKKAKKSVSKTKGTRKTAPRKQTTPKKKPARKMAKKKARK